MISNKYRRSNFTEIEEVGGLLECDLVNNHWDLFRIKRPMGFFTMLGSYIQRPDLLSLALYGKMNYWWILAKHNRIDDWWNDVSIGDVIDVVDVADIEDFYLSVRQRRLLK